MADTLDESTPPKPSPHRSDPDVAKETMALLVKYFPDHPTFELKDAERMMYRCIWDCFEMAESAQQCLAILGVGRMCPTNEGKRNSLRASERLGGYIRSSFIGWSREFAASDQVNHPNYETVSDRVVRRQRSYAFFGRGYRVGTALPCVARG